MIKRRHTIGLTILAVAGLALGWFWWSNREPSYQGKTLAQWLDACNEAGGMQNLGLFSEAIRAMGTNSLPYLLAPIGHEPSNLPAMAKEKLLLLIQKHRWVTPPIYYRDPYQYAAMLALHELGSNAIPALAELKSIGENPGTSLRASLALLAIGTNSIPTLDALCESTNFYVRRDAMRAIASLTTGGPPHYSMAWHSDPINKRTVFSLFYAPGSLGLRPMVILLDDPAPAVRRAAAEYILSPGLLISMSDRDYIVKRLGQTLNDPDPDVRKAAAESLKKIDPQAAAVMK